MFLHYEYIFIPQLSSGFSMVYSFLLPTEAANCHQSGQDCWQQVSGISDCIPKSKGIISE